MSDNLTIVEKRAVLEGLGGLGSALRDVGQWWTARKIVDRVLRHVEQLSRRYPYIDVAFPRDRHMKHPPGILTDERLRAEIRGALLAASTIDPEDADKIAHMRCWISIQTRSVAVNTHDMIADLARVPWLEEREEQAHDWIDRMFERARTA